MPIEANATMQSDEIAKIYENIRLKEPALSVKDLSEREGVATVSPLLKGFGTTVGNAMRRVMLSSLPGAAVVSVKLSCGGEWVLHDFTTLPGVTEDVCEIVLNIKGIIAKLNCKGEKIAYIDVKGPKTVTAADIVADSDLEIINPEQEIAKVGEGYNFKMELRFDHGIGYVSSSKNKEKYDSGNVNELFVDSIFTPVLAVSYAVEPVRVDSSMDNDKLTLDVKTDGSITPTNAVIVGAQILKEYFGFFASLSGIEKPGIVGPDKPTGDNPDVLKTPIEDLDLSVRSYNGLKRSGINLLGDLVALSFEDVKNIKNLGVKSIDEIKIKLEEKNLKFKDSEN